MVEEMIIFLLLRYHKWYTF